MKIIFSLMLIFLLSIGIENEMKMAEGKICDVKLYNYCDENCYNDCPKMYGSRAIGFCNFDPPVVVDSIK
ncbi:hypothetical protein DEO72_LG3g351 [Vigna unguiculata]|uniref:Uncharacterized protein n=1 Tax=Vigna unguiculata TaxID=3917 RepID=A0A4D6LBJ2_VIGUN|nr:hypothetical protein DEO72_LG3g351 [Vigna unguiculata]